MAPSNPYLPSHQLSKPIGGILIVIAKIPRKAVIGLSWTECPPLSQFPFSDGPGLGHVPALRTRDGTSPIRPTWSGRKRLSPWEHS